MTGTVAQRQRPANVPRLALPYPDAVGTGAEVDTPMFSRQINVALGRSHSKRDPRRDVIFNLKHGSMVEKQKVPLATEPWSCGGREHGRITNNMITSRYCTCSRSCGGFIQNRTVLIYEYREAGCFALRRVSKVIMATSLCKVIVRHCMRNHLQ